MISSFEERILADPDDRATYEVFADWLMERSDPRGELMRVQLDLENDDLTGDQRGALDARASDLIDEHLGTWLGSLAPLLERSARVHIEFERGLLHTLDSDVFTDEALEHLGEFPWLRQLCLQWHDEYSSWSDAGLEHIAGLKILGWLLLDGPVTNSGLAHVARLERLQSLKIRCRDVDDDGLVHLAGLTGLRKLELLFCHVEGPGLIHLAGLINLRELDLGFMPRAAEHVHHLGALRSLHTLKIGGPDIDLLDLATLVSLRTLKISGTPSDTQLAQLAPLNELEVLSFDASEVTDAGLAHLGKLTKLHEVDLSNSKVTDVGLAQLHHMRSLEYLHIENTDTTSAGEEELRAALPECAVLR